MIRAAACMFALLAAPAFAAPPPMDSDDWRIMGPYKEWATSQHDLAGRWCCDIGDGRPVDAEIFENCNLPPGDVPDKCPAQMPIGAHWWAHVTSEHWPDERDRWMMIPDEKITSGINPIGVPILWLYQSRVQCFAPPDGP